MSSSSLISREKRILLEAFFNKYEWIHIVLGMLGNFTFFIGSIFFFWESWKIAGIWLFVIGSFLMLIGSIGDALVKYIDNKQQ